MRSHNLGYFFREGIRGIFLHGFMSFASVCVTVACLIIMGTFSLILLDMNEMIQKYEQENQIMVYIDEDYSPAEAKSVGSYINMITNVYKAEFVSRDQALHDFVQSQGNSELFNGIDSSTLRDRFVITLVDSTQMRETVDMIYQIDGVADVSAHYEIMEGFSTLQQILWVASTIIILVLFIVSLLIVSNTIKLALYDRKGEIAIMRMVGATNSFIRTPYLIEGIILGLFGAALAFFAEWGLYDLIGSRVSAVDTMQLLVILPFESFRTIMICLYAATGFLIGLFGSLLSIRKFLNV